MQSVAIIGGGASGVTLASLLASRTIEENYLDVHLFEAGDDVLEKLQRQETEDAILPIMIYHQIIIQAELIIL